MCVVSCHGIGDCIPWHWWLHSMALVAAFHGIDSYILHCVTVLPLSGALQLPQLSGSSLFSPESGATDIHFWRFLYFIFYHITMPLSGVPQHPWLSGSSLFSPANGAADAPFCSFTLFFITSQCHLTECHNTCNFPGVPFFLQKAAQPWPGLALVAWGYLYFMFYHIAMPCNTCDFPEVHFSSLESITANPLLEFLYFVFITSWCHFSGVPQHQQLSGSSLFSSRKQCNLGQFFCTGSMQVATHCLQELVFLARQQNATTTLAKLIFLHFFT